MKLISKKDPAESRFISGEMSVEEKFGFSVTKPESDAFLDLIGLQPHKKSPSYGYLTTILTAVLGTIPFHNITLLTRGRKVPSIEEIKKDLLSGLGGPCGHINPFLGALLDNLGFEVHLVSGSMMQPNCHLALLIYLEEGRFYCDCGDGRPYFYPMSVNTPCTYNHPSLTWRTYPVEKNQFALDVMPPGKAWKRSCTVDLRLRPFSFFEEFIFQHYMDDNYGPFQSGFRLFWYPNQEIFGIRDLTFLSQNEQQFLQADITDSQEFTEILEQHFSVPQTLARQACLVLADRSVKPFINLY